MGAYPHVVDWNNDGKKDLISGDMQGQVWLFLNTGTGEAPELAAGVQVQADGVPIIAARYATARLAPRTSKLIGKYSKLHYADWDGDGLNDLLVGQDGTSSSQVAFYKNIGTQSEPKFEKPELLKLPRPKMLRPSPYVVDWDGDGKQDMLFGTDRAKIYFFKNSGTNEKPRLKAGKKLGLTGGDFSTSWRCRLDVTDWNEDGKLDLLIGNFYRHKRPMSGDIWLFLAK